MSSSGLGPGHTVNQEKTKTSPSQNFIFYWSSNTQTDETILVSEKCQEENRTGDEMVGRGYSSLGAVFRENLSPM